jgi:hypothetical protein
MFYFHSSILVKIYTGISVLSFVCVWEGIHLHISSTSSHYLAIVNGSVTKDRVDHRVKHRLGFKDEWGTEARVLPSWVLNRAVFQSVVLDLVASQGHFMAERNWVVGPRHKNAVGGVAICEYHNESQCVMLSMKALWLALLTRFDSNRANRSTGVGEIAYEIDDYTVKSWQDVRDLFKFDCGQYVWASFMCPVALMVRSLSSVNSCRSWTVLALGKNRSGVQI